VSVAAGIPIYLELGGLINSSTAGSYTTTVTTQTAVPATIDSAISPSVTFASTNTAVTVSVAKSLNFTLGTSAFELDLDPSLAALADQTATVAMTVSTNAHSGYTLVVAGTAAGLSNGASSITAVSAGKATSVAWPGPSRYGYTVTGTGATIDAAFAASKYAGFTSGGEQIASRAGATGGSADTINVAVRVAIDYSVPALVYGDTLTFTVTPNYT
jgi:hypothetical protein